MQVATVRYQIATYSGTIRVYFEDGDTEDDEIISRAKRHLRQRIGVFPLGMHWFEVTGRMDCEE